MSDFVATLFHGCLAGSFLFASVVDVRTLMTLVNIRGQEENVRSFLQIWWPAGRDLMAPLGLLTSAGILITFAFIGSKNFFYKKKMITSSLAYFLNLIFAIIQNL